ncbi:MarR family winged helix-turn-helix transcriptional regulator [Mycobacterium sp. 21AC1]|uniref:MarR family winged helix-turn-helix transcriptional regulator n=1 Tax=[Mycobacterium] appelbergii TaxID=2939269 RepID=UPI00293943A5|nr:MarR family winged helix-turn-helix transcriptional regulator [Mycobacterium sp. 21AC1]MDV3124508.1 MarR family winged helix-turn-helix transcriptional regulator [Mycobacterium sp. 21AC1]
MNSETSRARPERELVLFQTSSLQRHAIEFGEWMMRASLERAHSLGHTGLRPAHARLMVFLSWEGSRISDIARAQDVSKNAIGQLVDELEKLGYVERVADPQDRRAKVVRYTRQGVDMMADAAAVGERLDAEIADIIGARRLGQLRSALADICQSLQLGPA